jgi:methionyl-tRNA formyltransferase
MKLCIAGKNNIAVDCLYFSLSRISKDEICVILNQGDTLKNTWQKSLGYTAKKEGVKIVNLEDIYSIHGLVFLSLEFDQIIIPSRFHSKSLLNIHLSFLPEYKGVYTSLLPILHGKNKSGVTLHEIDSGIDTGNIIAQTEIPIDNKTACRVLYFQLLKAGTELICEKFNNILSNSFASVKQAYNNSSYFSRKSLNFALKEINPFQTAFQIQRNVNAFVFREYQMPTYKGPEINRVEITNTRSAFKPGKVIAEDQEKIEIATIDYNVILFKDYYRLLMECCLTDNSSKAENFISYISDINESNENGWTPLIVASYNGSIDIVNLLIKRGADVNKANLNGTTPLMYAKDYAITTGNIDILNILLDNGANLQTKDITGKTVIDYIDVRRNGALYKFLSNKLNND